MPPKRARNYDAIAKAAQMAGLSNAAPSFRLQDPATHPAVDPVDQALGPKELLPHPSPPIFDFCNFCGRRALELLVCEECLAKVCVNPQGSTSKCISLPQGGTASGHFRCPHCVRLVAKANTQTVSEVRFTANSGRVHSKVTWPLLLVHMAPVDTTLWRTLVEDLAQQYSDQRENLFLHGVRLVPGGHAATASRLQAAVLFDQQSFEVASPANKFVVLEAECDPATGGFDYGAAFGTVPDILTHFLGERFRARLAAPLVPPDATSRGLFHESANARGGWRGLFLVSQGPWVHQGQRISDVVSLVQAGDFDFVVALSSDEITPAQLAAFLSAVVRNVGIDRATPSQAPLPSLWEGFVRSLESCRGVVDSTPVIFIFRERSADPTSPAICRKIATHSPPYTAWGVHFVACGGPHSCHVTQADVGVRNHRGDSVRIQCLKCGWKSRPANARDFIQLVHPVFAESDRVFWHAFPPSPQLVSAFVQWSRQ